MHKGDYNMLIGSFYIVSHPVGSFFLIKQHYNFQCMHLLMLGTYGL